MAKGDKFTITDRGEGAERDRMRPYRYHILTEKWSGGIRQGLPGFDRETVLRDLREFLDECEGEQQEGQG